MKSQSLLTYVYPSTYKMQARFPAFYTWMCVSPEVLKSDAEERSFSKLDYSVSIMNLRSHPSIQSFIQETFTKYQGTNSGDSDLFSSLSLL